MVNEGLEVFDFLGDSIKLRHRGRSTVHTTMGGVLSVCAILIWVYIITVELRNVIHGNDGELSSIQTPNNIA